MKKFSTLIKEEDLTSGQPAPQPETKEVDVIKDPNNKNAVSVDVVNLLKDIQVGLLSIDFLEITKYVDPDSDMASSLKQFDTELSTLRKDIEDCIIKNHSNIIKPAAYDLEDEQVKVNPDDENVEKIALSSDKEGQKDKKESKKDKEDKKPAKSEK